MAKKFPKVNNASYRVFKTLLLLFEEDLTMNELIKKLNDSRDETDTKEYNNFVVSKYINTCKCCGIDIQKIDGKYSLMNFPFTEKFTDDESKLVFELINNKENKKLNKLNEELLTKLHLPLYKSSNGLKSIESARIIKLFDKSLKSNSKVELIMRDASRLECTPNGIKSVDGRVVFSIVGDSGVRDISPDDIADIKLSDKSVRKTKIGDDEVIFELKGRLAKRYQLRENEQIIRIKKDGSIVVSNKYEEKDELLRRLMRYDYLCKLMKPDIYVEEYKQMIADTLANYGF